MIPVAIGLASGLLFVLAAAAIGARLCLYPRPLEVLVRSRPSLPSDHGTAFDAFEVSLASGTVLRGWWIPALQQPAPATVVGLVGSASPKTDWASFACLLRPSGLDVMICDARGHGESDAAPLSWGPAEASDLVEVWNALAARGRPMNRLILVGTSLGANVALRLAATDKRVVGVLAQSSFTSICEAAHAVARRFAGPIGTAFVRLVIALADFGRPGQSLCRASVLDVAHAIGVPTLVVQGSNDVFVPMEQAERIHAAVGSADKELLVVEGGGHVSLWKKHHPAYHQKLLEFVGRVSTGLLGA